MASGLGLEPSAHPSTAGPSLDELQAIERGEQRATDPIADHNALVSQLVEAADARGAALGAGSGKPSEPDAAGFELEPTPALTDEGLTNLLGGHEPYVFSEDDE
jgi:hypothetical protein